MKNTNTQNQESRRQDTEVISSSAPNGILERLIWFCLSNRLVVLIVVVAILLFAGIFAPFDWELSWLARYPVAADAIPDIGENQQIVFTEWEGRSPQDVEDQITYPLTISLLGLPKVKTIRSRSMFGFSTIFIIFDEDAEFYWTRSRILEKLSSLPDNVLPDGVRPTLGPDATALDQIFWYTLEGQDENGAPTGGWDLVEFRSIQDWKVRYALQSAEGVSEVASVGGYVQEYQIDADPDAMRAHGVTMEDLYRAVTESNIDVGARSIEINKVEYFIRGVGFVKTPEDIAEAVLKSSGGAPLRVRHVAQVSRGPAYRQGALDKGGAEVVGGVVVVRHGANPLQTIKNVKEEIAMISPSLPSKVIIDHDMASPEEIAKFADSMGFEAYIGSELNQREWVKAIKGIPPGKRPDWVKLSQVSIVPFYDRTGLIYETLGTLGNALYMQILVTMIVIIVMLAHLRSAILVSAIMPFAVAMCFIFMKIFGIDANIVSLGGIAIAIGTVVDMGIVVSENILRHLQDAGDSEDCLKIVYHAAVEEGGAVLTAVATTVVSFMTIFALEGSEGKLFRPLAYTYIFVIAASLIVSLAIIPAGAYLLIGRIRCPIKTGKAGMLLRAFSWMILLPVSLWLAFQWLPLGAGRGIAVNLIWILAILAFFLSIFLLFRYFYQRLLSWSLDHKLLFALIPLSIYLLGIVCWLGSGRIFSWLPAQIKQTQAFSTAWHLFPGFGKEFMPPLDEGSYLFMPTTMPHAGIGEALDVLQKQDKLMLTIPEVESVVGKLGRAETALDPAPKEMFETLINYKTQFISDRSGRRLNFKFNPKAKDLFRDKDGTPLLAPDGLPYIVMGIFERDPDGRLIPDKRGRPFRLWRPPLDPALNPGRKAWRGIEKPDDIWDEVVRLTEIPGTTSAPRLQPIAARIVMLQSGIRAPMGIKIKGQSLEDVEEASLQIERHLKEVPSVESATVFAERIEGKPYIEVNIKRSAAARYGLSVSKIQETIEIALGGKRLSKTVEGRERYPIRIRYKRELRDSPEEIGKLLLPSENGAQIPLSQVAEIKFLRGPQEIRSEDGFLTGYVLFDKKADKAEVDVVNECHEHLIGNIASGEIRLPSGVSFQFAGNYEGQVRSEKKLMIILPISLMAIFIILYLQFRQIPTAFIVFIDIASSWAAGFIMLWLCSQSWFLNFNFLGANMREVFQIGPVNLSVAVWVGFLSLFGIATDDGVVLSSYLDDCFSKKRPGSVCEIRTAVLEGANRRVRACLMTTVTTVIALLPIFTSTGRGADIMRPMALPVFAGMMMAIITPIFVPVLYCAMKEIKFKLGISL